ncbi:MAG: hypothetical protein ACOZCF_07110 [Bacillota bacterium]
MGEKESLKGLAAEVLKRSVSPRDPYEVAALLESMGWTDEQAASAFGREDVFGLARDVFELCTQSVTTRPVAKEPRLSFFAVLWNYVNGYLRGMMFAMPMAVSIFTVLTIRYSLWSYVYFSVEVATAIALGTIGSLLVTGGFCQAIARRGLMYVTQNEYNLARRFSFLAIRLGLIVVILVGLAVFIFNLIFTVFPMKMMSICLYYYFFLSCLWLTIAVLYMLRRELLFTGMIVLGIVMVFLMHEYLKMDIMVSQAIGLSAAAILAVVVVSWLFRRYERPVEPGIEVPPIPRTSIVVYTVMPYFVYGFLYFALLCTDRIVAWSANSVFMPYLIWFRGQYELGLDWALLALILPMGVVEVLINNFWFNVPVKQKSFSASNTARFNRVQVSAYYRQRALYGAIAVLSGLLVYLGTRFLETSGILDLYLFSDRVTYFVFTWGIVGYVFLTAGLLNALYLFSLSRPEPVVRATAYGVAANLSVGFVLSRIVEYHWAVLGLVAGAAVFFAFTTVYAVKSLGALDYYLYYLT